MSRFQLGLLGALEARAGSQPIALHVPTKALALLAFLAARPGQAHSRDQLAGLLWGEGGNQALHSLRQALMSLRRALTTASLPALIVADGDTLAFDTTQADVDVAVFERCLGEGGWDSLAQAATLYRGDFLEGFALDEVAFEEWSVGERERLRELLVEALARLLQHHQQRPDGAAAAIQVALRLLRLDRTQEVVHRTLMRLYVRQGRRAEALRQYGRCLSALRDELGLEPEPETVRLQREILRLRPATHPFLEAAEDPRSAPRPTS
jgi:DNA-binding SARP family transcriptional activator